MFSGSWESILPIWSSTAQSRRSQADACAPELFILLHGMLFTNIRLDNFLPTLACFLERIKIKGAEEHEWIMMAVMNIGAMFEYGRLSGVLCKIGGIGARDTGAVKVAKKYQPTPAFCDKDGEEK
ncbi:uncharacterized protein BJ212DRAFT_1485043 [Suillus subaureus]|uniref:Uncharacterized protein n=1 Tax=Suillus subaureus TaxID=48587 RepID=A0A9P7E1G6_9AGAM|nr:uncharacterized protein BJ212DRAFT_1485043 [Suillus subaureus]KAG1808411.1 hypothetical protein BJ212DRAFT_1485043 [Suillus subaureus]